MLRNSVCLVIAHMVDATQLCLSCHCTHGGCYATVFVFTWWMLRNCVCLVIAHMVDATQLCLSCHCTHGGCYATVFVLSRDVETVCSTPGSGTMSISLCIDTTKTYEKPPGEAKQLFA